MCAASQACRQSLSVESASQACRQSLSVESATIRSTCPPWVWVQSVECATSLPPRPPQVRGRWYVFVVFIGPKGGPTDTRTPCQLCTPIVNRSIIGEHLNTIVRTHMQRPRQTPTVQTSQNLPRTSRHSAMISLPWYSKTSDPTSNKHIYIYIICKACHQSNLTHL